VSAVLAYPIESPPCPRATNDNLDGFTGHIKERDKIDPLNKFLLSATGLNPCIFYSKNCTVQARYYDPVIGRFLSIDPVTFMDTGNPGMFNRYSYVSNNPINLIDPTGMIERELNPGDNSGRFFVVEAGDLSQEQVNKIADQLPDGVFDALDGQDLSVHSVSTSTCCNSDGDFIYGLGTDNEAIINIGNQIGTGLVPDSKDFPSASSLSFFKTDTKNGQANTNNNNTITSRAIGKGISQVISTSVHERRHQAPGDQFRSEKQIHEETAKALQGTGVTPK